MSWSAKAHKRNKDGMFTNNVIRSKCQSVVYEDEVTEQSHKRSTDMHYIRDRAMREGIDIFNEKYDFTPTNYLGVPDYQDAQNMIAATNTMFEKIPAEVREKFKNDAGNFVDWLSNQNNYEEIKEMGFDVSHLKAPVVQEPKTEPEPQV